MFPEKYRDNRNIGPFKYRFRLSIFQMNYLIDNIDYRLSHGLSTRNRKVPQIILYLRPSLSVNFVFGQIMSFMLFHVIKGSITLAFWSYSIDVQRTVFCNDLSFYQVRRSQHLLLLPILLRHFLG
jgi:hypothetical protein